MKRDNTAMRIWQAWVRVFTRKEDPCLLAAFRIGIGLSVLVLLSMALFSGVVEMVWLDRAYGGIFRIGDGTPLISFLGGPKPVVIWTVIALSFASGLALMVGFLGKVSAFLALQGILALSDLNFHAPGGGATLLLTNALWLLVLSRSSTTWSIDCYLKTNSLSTNTPVPAWPRYLAVVQILLCYFCTGIQKVSIHWLPGGDFSALYYILMQPAWQRFDTSFLAFVFPLTQIATVSVWLWEIAAPLWGISLCLFATAKSEILRRMANVTRWSFFFVGIIFHVLIHVFMDIGVFSLVSLSYYPCLLAVSDLALFRAVLQRFYDGEKAVCMRAFKKSSKSKQ